MDVVGDVDAACGPGAGMVHHAGVQAVDVLGIGGHPHHGVPEVVQHRPRGALVGGAEHLPVLLGFIQVPVVQVQPPLVDVVDAAGGGVQRAGARLDDGLVHRVQGVPGVVEGPGLAPIGRACAFHVGEGGEEVVGVRPGDPPRRGVLQPVAMVGLALGRGLAGGIQVD